MSDSRSRFEAWALMRISSIEYDTSWEAWQAAEAETARRCAELDCIYCICRDFPEAFK